MDNLPQKLWQKLLPFQRDGVNFAVKKDGRCLIADEMGLGKTLQAISVACVYKEEWPLLIIVPSSLKFSWIEELEKWIPDILPNHINLVHSGTDASGISNTPISIISYGLLRLPSSIVIRTAITARKFKVVICDESHYLKNPKSLSTKVIVPIIKSAKRKILLSGTPALAKPVEIDSVCPGRFGSFWQFTERYCDAHMVFYGREKRHRNVDGASNLEELQKKMHSLLMIRREKSEVLTELPPKQRQRVMFDLKESAQKKEILHRIGQLRENITKGNTFFQLLIDKESDNDATLDTGQSQSEEHLHEERVDNDGMDVNQSEDTSVFREVSTLYRLSGEAKIGPVRDYIDMLCENDSLKFLVFAYHHAMMDGIQQTLHDKNVKFVRIDGQTKGLERQACVNAYQSDSSIRVAILSILAAGVGLTLTAAKLVVFAELYWTPGVMIQCEDRAHRIGQVDSLPIHYLVAKNTMDEWVWSAVCRKTYVTSTALTGKSQKLEHEEGDTYQIDVLSNADMWKANGDKEHVNVSELIKSQRAPDQPSILNFLSPSRKTAISAECPNTHGPGKKKTKKFTNVHSVADCLPGTSKKSEPVNRLETHLEEVIVLDSDDEEAFKPPSKKRKRLKDNQHEGKTSDIKQKLNKMVEFDDKKSNGSSADVYDDFVSESVQMTPKCVKNKTTSSESFESDFVPKDRDETLSGNSVGLNTDADRVTPLYTSCKDKNKVISDKSGASCIDSSSGDDLTLSDGDMFEEDATSLTNNVQWPCSLCTFINHSDLRFCEMCESPKRKLLRSNMTDKKVLEAKSHTKKSLTIEESKYDENSNCDFLTELEIIPDSQEASSLTIEASVVALKETNHDEKGDNKSLTTDNPTFTSVTSTHGIQKQSKQLNSDVRPPKSPKISSAETLAKPASPVDSKEDQDFTKISTLCSLNDECEENSSNKNPSASQYKSFKFSCSMHTGRVFVYNEQGVSLQANFFPIDIEMGNIAELPHFLRQPHHLKLIQRFVREWSSLANTKKKLIAKRGLVFEHPILASEEVKSVHGNTQRHMTKNDLKTAMDKAKVKQGSVRLISHPNQSLTEEASSSNTSSTTNRGVNQVIDQDGVPLCLQCGKPYSNSLLPKQMISASENAWLMRLCSYTCMDKYWTLNHASYCRDQIYGIERGICQLCQFGAHEFYNKMKVIKDVKKRADILMKSPYHKLGSSLREKMVLHPVPGQFWHVDHILPVWKGGGMCDVDNLRTLCTPCHAKVTSRQAGQRAAARKLSSAASSGDIAAFFQR